MLFRSTGTISGGYGNVVTGTDGVIGGGVYNTVSGTRAGTASGVYNTASGNCSFVGGGCRNCATTNYASVVGGINNTSSGVYGTSSGYKSTAGGSVSTAFGNCARALGPESFATGYQTTASGYRSSVAGGANNTASGNCSAVLGGSSNTASAAWSGAFGCNLTANVACTFFTNNQCTCGTVTATCFVETSSQRFKCCIQPLFSTDQVIKDLNPVRFRWIDQNKGTHEEYGLIAEEVHKVLPEAVKLDQEGLPEGVSYTKLVPILIKAVQELQARVEQLEQKQ